MGMTATAGTQKGNLARPASASPTVAFGGHVPPTKPTKPKAQLVALPTTLAPPTTRDSDPEQPTDLDSDDPVTAPTKPPAGSTQATPYLYNRFPQPYLYPSPYAPAVLTSGGCGGLHATLLASPRLGEQGGGLSAASSPRVGARGVHQQMGGQGGQGEVGRQQQGAAQTMGYGKAAVGARDVDAPSNASAPAHPGSPSTTTTTAPTTILPPPPPPAPQPPHHHARMRTVSKPGLIGHGHGGPRDRQMSAGTWINSFFFGSGTTPPPPSIPDAPKRRNVAGELEVLAGAAREPGAKTEDVVEEEVEEEDAESPYAASHRGMSMAHLPPPVDYAAAMAAWGPGGGYPVVGFAPGTPVMPPPPPPPPATWAGPGGYAAAAAAHHHALAMGAYGYPPAPAVAYPGYYAAAAAAAAAAAQAGEAGGAGMW
ncbi:hypothetical protein HDU96_002093 [Phlyctochytrium bullatum]|nr:hypothetical protein HDU96_002093 [Phlyctochytrium bullatum]